MNKVMSDASSLTWDHARMAAVASIALTAPLAVGQPVPLPPVRAGVQTFVQNGHEFSRVRAQVVQPVPSIGSLPGPFGAGDWDFGISRTEVSQGQWIEFINTFNAVPVPAGQPYTSVVNSMLVGGWAGAGIYFTELGPLGRPINRVTPDGAVRPVSGQGWLGAAMYANWLHNDRGTTLDSILNGAYDLRGWDLDNPSTWPTVTRSPEARYWIPSYDEWCVASFFDPDRHGSGQPGWWEYQGSRDRLPIPGAPGVGETAAGWNSPDGPFASQLLPIGSYPNTQTPWGLLDTSGTYPEVNEDTYLYNEFDRLFAGTKAGPFTFPDLERLNERPGRTGAGGPRGLDTSIRLATSVVPGPSVLVSLCAFLNLCACIRRRT